MKEKSSEQLYHALCAKLRGVYPLASDGFISRTADRIMRCDLSLRANIREWAAGRPLTDTYYRGKYTLRMASVLCGGDVVRAMIALDEYIRDAGREELIWLRKK